MNDNLYIDGQLELSGTRGYSAYEVAVRNGFVGTEEEWLASLVGPQGPQGEQGEQGVQGEPGPYPNLRMGSVETLAPTEQAYANFTGTPQNPILHMGIPQGIQGIQGIQGPQGEQGIQGKPFTVVKTYSSVSAMQADFNNMSVGDYVMIATSVEIEDNAKLYYRSETQWVFISDFSGAQGIQGEQGPTGPQGVTGNGIASVTKTSSDPTTLIDTYTILFTNGTTTTFTVQNGFDGEVQQEDLDEVIEVNNKQQNEIDLLNMLYDMFPKTTGEGTNITLNNTKKARLGVDLSGDLSQETTSGKNKLPYSLQDIKNANILGTWNGNVYTYNGITFTVNGDLSVTIGGTFSERAYLYLESAIARLSSDSYLLNGCPSGGSLDTYKINIDMYDENTRITGTYAAGIDVTVDLSSYTNPGIRVYIDIRDASAIGKTFYPMLRLATESDDSYEPYTGNQPSPSPDYPQEIKVVTGNQNVKIHGKNLFDKNYYIEHKNDFINVNQGYFYALELDDEFKTQFTASIVNNGIDLTNYVLAITDSVGSSPSNSSRLLNTDGTIKNITFDFTNSEHVYLQVGGSVQGTGREQGLELILNNYNIQIEQGTIATTYEQYQEQNYPINLGVKNLLPITLTSQTKNQIEVTVNDDKSITLNGTANAGTNLNLNYTSGSYVSLVSGKTYTISIKNNSGVYFRLSKVSDNSTVATFDTPKTTLTFTSNYTGDCYAYITILNDTLLNNLTIYPIIQEGTKITGYSAYGTTPIELCNIGNYKDYIYRENGKWYKYGVIGKLVFNGNENWLANTVFTQEYMVLKSEINLDLRQNSTQFLSDYFLAFAGSPTPKGKIRIGNTYLCINYDDGNGGVNNFKNWLSTHNTIVYYVLETPTTTEITDTTLTTQLDNLYNANSYDDTTIIFSDGNLPIVMKATSLISLDSVYQTREEENNG